MVFIPSLLNLGEFLLSGNGLFVIVRVRLARKLSAGIASIEREFAEVIAGLRLVPRNGPVSCELWLYSRYGTLRHFRIMDDRLVEIDCCGILPDTVKPGVTGSLPGRGDTTAPHETTATGPASSGTAAPPRDPILRWLAKKNAAKKVDTGADTMGSNELKKILDAGIPRTKAIRIPGKTAGSRRAGKVVPEERPEPEKPVAGETSASPAGTGPALKEKTLEGTPGSPVSSRDNRDSPITGGT